VLNPIDFGMNLQEAGDAPVLSIHRLYWWISWRQRRNLIEKWFWILRLKINTKGTQNRFWGYWRLSSHYVWPREKSIFWARKVEKMVQLPVIKSIVQKKVRFI
jgi:hypothetical protein